MPTIAPALVVEADASCAPRPAAPSGGDVAQLRDAEVEDLHEVLARARLHDHDVAGLHVAVDDPGVVRLGERPEDLLADLGDAPLGERAGLAEHGREVLAGDVLHREVEAPAGVVDLAEVEDPDRVRVGEARDDPRLVEEAVDRAGLAGEVAPQDLEGERLAHPDVLGPVDRAHAALADERDEPVAIRDDAVHEPAGAGEVGRLAQVGAAARAEVHRPRRGIAPRSRRPGR